MGFNAAVTCEPRPDWDSQTLRDAFTAQEPADVAYCAGAVQTEFRDDEAGSLAKDIKPAEIEPLAARVEQLPEGMFGSPTRIDSSPFGALILNQHRNTADIRRDFFAATLSHTMRQGIPAAQSSNISAVLDRIAEKAKQPGVVTSFGERHLAQWFGEYPDTVLPDYELVAIAGAWEASATNGGDSKPFKRVAQALIDNKLLSAMVGALVGYHGARHIASPWLMGDYSPASQLLELTRSAISDGDPATQAQLAAAIDANVAHIKQAHSDTSSNARGGNLPDLGWLKLASHMLRNVNAAPPHATAQERKALQADLRTVQALGKKLQSEPKVAIDNKAGYQAAQALVRLGKDADLFAQATSALTDVGMAEVVKATIAYDPKTGKSDIVAGSYRPQTLLQDLAKLAYSTNGIGRAVVGSGFISAAKDIAEANTKPTMLNEPRIAALPLSSVGGALFNGTKL